MKMPSGRRWGLSGWARSLFVEVHNAQATCARFEGFRYLANPIESLRMGPGPGNSVSPHQQFASLQRIGGLMPALIGLASRPQAGRIKGVELRLTVKPGVTDGRCDWLGGRRRIGEGGEIMYSGESTVESVSSVA